MKLNSDDSQGAGDRKLRRLKVQAAPDKLKAVSDCCGAEWIVVIEVQLPVCMACGTPCGVELIERVEG